MLKKLIIVAILIAFIVIALGAYTRLKDAGLGCPDWPGCYGQLTVPDTRDSIDAANAAYPDRPVEAHKAWIEMIHRYAASTLGLLIIGIAYLSFRQKRRIPETPTLLPLSLVGLVMFQGLLGMWTVTLGLYPPAVMGHLLGGFATLSLLWILLLRHKSLASNSQTNSARTPQMATSAPTARSPTRNTLMIGASIALILLTLQIALGGWTSSNYAAIVCTDFPLCQGEWQDQLDFKEAFRVTGHAQPIFEYGQHLAPESKMTIHITHRVGALIVTLALAMFAFLVMKRSARRSTRGLATSLLILLAIQVALGISNILLMLPLPIAVAHNVGALLLLLNLITLLVAIRGETSWKDPSPSPAV